MATLYVENVPDELYSALRNQAKRRRKSIAAEVVSLLEQNVITPKEMKSRREWVRRARRLRALKPLVPGPFPSTEEMVREDRER
jgi:plasmid stability protein